MIFLPFDSNDFPFSGTRQVPIMLSGFFILFQITMPKCHKNYPKCIWQFLTEWHTLDFYSALLFKVYWNNATHIVRVCVTPIWPKASKFDLTDKCNLQVHFGSKANASFHERLCHHSLTCPYPLLEELLFLSPCTISFTYLWLNRIWKFWWRIGKFNRLFSLCILFGWFDLLF